jgi:integrase
MPRTPSIRYFESRQGYYCQYQGRQHLLAPGPRDEPNGPVYKRAVERFAEVMHLGDLAQTTDECPVSAVVTRYCYFLNQEGRKSTQEVTRTLLKPAVAAFGHVRVRDLRPIMVTDWLASMAEAPRKDDPLRLRAWGTTTRSMARDALGGAFNWAVKQGLIGKNPIAGLARLERRTRGKEVVLPEQLQDLLVALANPETRKVLAFLRGTGSRPGEAIHADCKHFKPDLGAIVFPWNPPPGEWRWKAGKKTKRDRVIHLTPELKEMVEAELKARGGKGRIFQTRRRRPWTYRNLRCRLAKIVERPEVVKWCKGNGADAGKVMLYGFRHSFATRMLLARCPVKLLADLMGTSVKQIEATYSHAHDDLEAMHRLFEQFTAAATAGQPRP